MIYPTLPADYYVTYDPELDAYYLTNDTENIDLGENKAEAATKLAEIVDNW